MLRFRARRWLTALPFGSALRIGALVLAGSVFLYGAWPWLPLARARPARTLVFYGFSILAEVMDEGIFPAFQAEWEQRTGERIEFVTSFSGSGTITNQMILGVPAEVSLLSLELDALRLQEAGVVSGPTWRDLPYAGVVNRTPFIILVRPGNPLGIHDFSDLARPGIGIVHPDPLTSGGAQWAILAEYGSALRATGDEELAYEQLLGIWRNVVAQAASARAARTQFESGFGDALITYEQEVLTDLASGHLQAEIVYPRSTILSEHMLVVLEQNVAPEEEDLVNAFVDFLWTEPAQRIFVEYGFRSILPELDEVNPSLASIEDPFTVAELGGWVLARRQIIDDVWKARVLPEVGR